MNLHPEKRKWRPIWSNRQRCWKVPLTRGEFALVSKGQLHLIRHLAWHASAEGHSKTIYATSNAGYGRKNRKLVSMHRVLLEITDPKILVDHRNGNGLDNRNRNLRPCSKSGNSFNAGLPSDNKSGFKGVSAHGNGKWRATIVVANRQRQVYYGHSKIAAARAYDKAVIKIAGEFAKTNASLGLL